MILLHICIAVKGLRTFFEEDLSIAQLTGATATGWPRRNGDRTDSQQSRQRFGGDSESSYGRESKLGEHAQMQYQRPIIADGHLDHRRCERLLLPNEVLLKTVLRRRRRKNLIPARCNSIRLFTLQRGQNLRAVVVRGIQKKSVVIHAPRAQVVTPSESLSILFPRHEFERVSASCL